jgi:hypothetical protein
MNDVADDARSLASTIEKTHGTNPPASFSRDQINLICKQLRKDADEIDSLEDRWDNGYDD